MADRDPRQTNAERRDQSQTALLDAAAALIAERGVEGASLASIAERAGASRGLPSHYFRSKDSLVAALAHRTQDRILAVMTKAVQQANHTGGQLSELELLCSTADTYLQLFAQPTADMRAFIVMWGSTFPSVSNVDGMVEADRRGFDGWVDHIIRGQQEGSITTRLTPEAAAFLLMGQLRGTAALLLTDAHVADIESVRDACRAWIRAALAPSELSSDRPLPTSKRRHRQQTVNGRLLEKPVRGKARNA